MGSRNNKPGRIVKGTALQPSLKSASGIWSLDEAMQAHRANAWPQPNLFQPISNCLRIKQQGGSISAGVLSKPIVRDGDRNRFTMSMWVKLGTLAAPGGSIRTLWEGFSGADNSYYLIYITSGNQLYIGRDDNGTPSGTTATWAGVLRDPNAWYHIVIATDTLQATAANRIKVWINGVQQTLGGDFPAQGYAVAMGVGDRNSNSVTNGFGPGIRIGSRWNLTFDQNFDGLYGEVNFVDGYQLDPSLFGKFDTNNTWVPVAYTGSYGTNGFYLPFTNATTSQTLGYDASLNGTTTYDADQDPYRGHVALHLTGNGPAGVQNNTFIDSSSTNNSITRTGEITQGSFSPYPLNANAPYNPAINGASAYFPKSGWLSAPTAAVSSLGTGDFTFESWVYPITFSTTTLFQRWFSFGTGLASDVTVNIDTSGYLVFRINDSTQLTSATTLTLNAWNHVAFVRSSGTVKFYINGYSGNSAAVATNITTQGQNPIIIGAEPGQSQGSAGDFYGYMSNFRVIKGVAVYTANFTPTMRPFGTLTNNLLTFSEDFANTAFWAQSNVSVTPSFAVAPDGTPSATKLILTSGNSLQKRLNFTSYTPGAGTYTFSVYAKAADYNYLVVTIYESSYKGAVFNLATGVIESTLASTTTSMTSVGNGWYRISVTATTGGTLNNNATGLWPYQNLPGNAGGNATSDGNSSGGVYIWGAQFESASSPSNYVPTPANFSTAPSLLLNFANAAVVDSAGTNNALTGGSATITSASKYGSGALSFASNGYLSFAPGSQYAFRTSDFTIEAWVRTTETTGDTFYRRIYMTDGPTGNAVGNIQLTIEPSTGYVNLWENSGGLDMLGTTNISTGAWFHVAATRAGTTLRLFVNGKQEAIRSHNTSIAPNSGTPRPWVGAYNSTQGRWNGQIDDLRVTKGLARYTSDFAPPARAYPEIGGDSFVTRNINAGVVRSFTTVGTTSWTAPLDVTQIELLVVAGGAGGGTSGANYCGGGGAGGLIYNSAYPVTPGAGYSITVGAGGAAQANGSNSVFGPLTAIGGGAGASAYATAGSSGGSGGGGGPINGNGGNGTAGQGFAGGIASSANQGGSDSGAGGGGGAGGIGGPGYQTGTGQFSNSPNGGGQGLNFGISGIPKWYAAGGTGSGYYYGGDTGTNGIGGSTPGAGGSSAVINGTANTGSGGGGGRSGTGGAGGSGIVIVRYTTTSTDATSDNLVDSPTQYGHDTGAGGEVVGNYCTLNPIDTETDHSFSNGNLTLFKAASNWSSVRSTMAFSSGKWYFETTYNASWDYAHVGVLDVTVDTYAGQVANQGYVGNYAKGWAYQQDQRVWNNGINIGSSLGAVRAYAGDTAMVAVDMDTGKIWFGVNGVWFNSGNPAAGTNAAYSNLSGTVSPAFSVYGNSSGIALNFGQRAWTYTPPAGFSALTTKNFARPAVGSAAATPNQYFDTVLYTGTGAAQTITLPGAFQPDLVWMKVRSAADNHVLMDSVRGTSAALFSDLTNAEVTNATRITSFNSDGFTLGSSASVNTSSATYVAWCWRAGGAAVSNTSGTLTSQVSANTASGFSVVTYTGNGTAGATVGHGLGAAPNLVIWKKRSSTSNWFVWSKAMDVVTGSTGWLYLNTTNAQQTSGSTNEYPTYKIDPTSTLITLNGTGSSNGVNDSSATYVAYCWAEIAGFSKFGSHTGNGSADGTFVYLGFRPRFIMTKRTDSTGDWLMVDTARDTFNPTTKYIIANSAGVEGTATIYDITSNGFKLRLTTDPNISTSTVIWAAFADKPFGNVNGVAR